LTKPTTTMLDGVLVPGNGARRAEAADLSLMTFDEREYRIDPAVAKEHRLHELMRQRVRILAVLRDGRVIGAASVELVGHPV